MKSDVEKVRLSARVSESLGIPEDALAKVPRLEILSNRKAKIEGFSGIKEYSEERILLQSKDGIISFIGTKLSIEKITDSYIILVGKIKAIEYM